MGKFGLRVIKRFFNSSWFNYMMSYLDPRPTQAREALICLINAKEKRKFNES